MVLSHLNDKRIMKNYILFSFLVITKICVSQQLPISSLYYWNNYLINPASTGHENNNIIQASSRFQWSGLNGAPQTHFFGGHGLIGKTGIGGAIISDGLNGNFNQLTALLNYSYFLQMDRYSGISFGISSVMSQYSFNGLDMELTSYDPALNVVSNQLIPDVNIGVMYKYMDLLKIGISVNQLLQSKLTDFNDIAEGEDRNKLVRQYNFLGSYKAYLRKDLAIEFYSTLRTVLSSPLQAEIGSRFISNDQASFGLGYRTSDAVLLLFAFEFDKFHVNYNMDITTSKLSDYSLGTHEVMLGFKFGKSRKPRTYFR